MLLERLVLKNYGRHAELVVDFRPQLNAIVGRNGAGKTTILDALLFLLSGVNRQIGKNEDNISQFALPGEGSFAELRFSHRGDTIRVKRSLLPNTAELNIGSERVRGITNCNAKIREILGLTPNQLDDYVFVEQRRIDAWFNKAPAARAEDMTSLFGSTGADAAFRAVQKALPSILPTVPAGLGDVQQQLRSLLQQQLELMNQASRFAKLHGSPATRIEELDGIITQYNQQIGRQSQLVSCRQTIADADAKILQLDASIRSADNDIAELRPHAVAWGDTASAAQLTLAQWEAYDKTSAVRAEYTKQVAAFRDEFSSRLPRMQPPVDMVAPTDTEFQTQLAAATTAVGEATALKNQLQRLQPGQPCPTCGSDAGDIAGKLQEHIAKFNAATAALTPLLQRQQRTAAYYGHATSRMTQRQGFRRRIASLKQQRRSLSATSRPAVDRATLQSQLETAATIAAGLAAAHQTRESLLRQQAETQTVRERAAATLQQLEMQAATISAEAAAAADAERKQLRELLTEKAGLDAKLLVVNANIAAARTKEHEIQLAMQTAAGVQYAVGKLKQIAEILHHTAAPRVLTQTRLEAMLDEVNSSLALLEAPFRVKLDEELTFWAEFLDGTIRQPDRRLSVGQRITLAIATRIAMNSTLVGDLGLLILDEPTAGLDAETLACVPAAIERLREISEARGLQVLFVTHEQSLIDRFDSVLRL